MEHYPHLDSGIYDVSERVMRPLALRQARRPRSDHGKARHFVSLTSAHHNRRSLSHQKDDEDDGASRASTPSPTTYLNSLKPVNYQKYKIPSPSEQVMISSLRDKPNCLINHKRFIKKLEVKERSRKGQNRIKTGQKQEAAWRETLILGEILTITSHSYCANSQKKMNHQYPTVAKIPVLDTGKFEQWQFRIQQYLQLEHYALWEKKKNDVKARTTLLLSLPDEHQLRFSKYKTARELWAAILLGYLRISLKQQYGNFKAEGTETLEQTFNRLQVISSQLQFMDVDIKKDDLNQKFLASLAPEWLIHTIVWRNRNDLDSMSLDDLYNHLKVYEAEVQKKPNSNSQDMAFISSSKNSNNKDGNIVCVTTATTAFPTGGVNVATNSQDTTNAFIASQSNGSQIKFEDINQIDEDDIEEMDIKWNMALLSMRADKFWKRTGKKISIQGSNVAGFDKSKVKCFNCHKMGHFARECRAPRSQERVRKESYRQGSKAEEKSSKALMAIDGVGWDWSYM
nr:hypothetical protein [Tanacetum cinerariifolium]